MTAGTAAGATVAVIGGGPAGLMAAEILSAAGARVTIYERMPSIGRKFLIAGRGGLNLTHSENIDAFISRYGDAAPWLRPIIDAFSPTDLVTWAEGLRQPTFVGSSGRIFPKVMKASPLLRAWLTRLAAQGVTIRTRTEWLGWADDGALRFRSAEGEERVTADAAILALGGASWPRLGANGAWTPWLRQRGVAVDPLAPANMGINIAWSSAFRDRFAGEPLKNAGLSISLAPSAKPAIGAHRGEMVVTSYGLEGGAIYALAEGLGRALRTGGAVKIVIDLRPDQKPEPLADRLGRIGSAGSTNNILRKAMKLSPLAINLMREGYGKDLPRDPAALARAIKAVPLSVAGVQGLERAISSAGGIRLDQLDSNLMLTALPGSFAAGEMLDWSAPTGGYLLQACFATGAAAAHGALDWLRQRKA